MDEKFTHRPGHQNRQREAIEKLARIAAIAGSLAPEQNPHATPSALNQDRRLALVRAMLESRRSFETAFAPDLFGDPARDMLLALYAAELQYIKLSVSSLLAESAAPGTTALRTLGTLSDREWIIREADPRDKRRSFVRLSPEARRQIDQWLNITGSRLAAAL